MCKSTNKLTCLLRYLTQTGCTATPGINAPKTIHTCTISCNYLSPVITNETLFKRLTSTIQQWVRYKVACPVQQPFSRLTLLYLADDVNFVADNSSRHLLWSANNMHRPTYTHTQHLWQQELRCCNAASLRAWNSLPSYLQQHISYRQFNWQLKTFLLLIKWPRCSKTVCLSPNNLTNLLTYYTGYSGLLRESHCGVHPVQH